MPIYGEFKDATISAGNNESSAVDLGREYDYLSLTIPQMEKCKLSLKVSSTLGGTYYSLGEGTSTDEETFGRAAIWMLGGWRYIKVTASQKQNNSVTIKVMGSRG